MLRRCGALCMTDVNASLVSLAGYAANANMRLHYLACASGGAAVLFFRSSYCLHLTHRNDARARTHKYCMLVFRGMCIRT